MSDEQTREHKDGDDGLQFSAALWVSKMPGLKTKIQNDKGRRMKGKYCERVS